MSNEARLRTTTTGFRVIEFKGLNIHFKLIGNNIDAWSCYFREREILGEVRWHPPREGYCYFPADRSVYTARDLDDIEEFIGTITLGRKKPIAERIEKES